MEFHFQTSPTISISFPYPYYPYPTPSIVLISYPSGILNRVKYLTFFEIVRTHLSLYMNFPYPYPTYPKFLGYLFFALPLRFAL